MNVEENFQQLQHMHGNQYSVPLLRLWARVLVNGHHDSLDEPPNLPQFKSYAAKGNPGLSKSNMYLVKWQIPMGSISVNYSR